MDIDTFNDLAPAAAAEIVRPCADIPAWIAAIVAGRPYADVTALLTAAADLAAAWGAPEIDHALAQHPRIGERSSGTATEVALSSSEQSGISGDEVALAEGNRAYEEAFGRIFLIRAAGRTTTEVLDQLRDRLGHDSETETVVVAGQLREIALLRLEGVFA